MEEPQSGEPEPFKDPVEYAEAEEKVLIPETHTNEVVIGGITIELTPLPVRVQKRVYAAFSAAEAAESVDILVNKLSRTAVEILNYYRASDQKLTVEWLEDNADDGTIYDLILQQVELGNKNSFYLRAVRALLLSMRTYYDELEKTLRDQTADLVRLTRQEGILEDMQSSLQDSAKPGESASVESSSTLKVSSD